MSFKSFDLSSKIKESEDELGIKLNQQGIIKINPSMIANWEYRDRNETELGDIQHLSNSIKVNGQAQPIIVTHITNDFKAKNENGNEKYVVIAGYRRWLACKNLNIDVECLIKDISISEAIGILLAENEKENVSDYSKGGLYHKLIKDEKINQTELAKRLGINKNKLSNFMAFNDFPEDLVQAIVNLNNVSSRTAGYIRSLIKKGDDYKQALIKHAKVIGSGAGERVIERLIKSELNNKKKKSDEVMDSLIVNDKKYEVYTSGKIKLSKTVQSDVNYKSFIADFKALFNKYYGNTDE